MQSKQESEYIAKVKAVLDSQTDPVKAIGKLIEIDMPQDIESSLNTIAITSTLSNIDTPGFDDFMENPNAEQECDGSVRLFKKSIKDLEDNNVYIHRYFVELAYSKISGENYTYKLTRQNVEADELGEAIDEKAMIRSEAPKIHPENRQYTLEDARLKEMILDSKDQSVAYESFVAIPGQ